MQQRTCRSMDQIVRFRTAAHECYWVRPLRGRLSCRTPRTLPGYAGCCAETAAWQPRQMFSSLGYTESQWRGAGGRPLPQRGASQADVDAAYRKLAMKHHPDRNQDNKAEAEKQFKQISEAYQAIRSGSASSPFGGGNAGAGGSPGGFPGGFAGSHAHMDPQMEAFLREMMRGPQLSEEQMTQMMAEAARRQGGTNRAHGPGFQSVHYEFSFGGRPSARNATPAEKEAMEAQMKAVNEELKSAMKTAAKEAAKAAGRAAVRAAANAAKRSVSRFADMVTSPFRSSGPRNK